MRVIVFLLGVASVFGHIGNFRWEVNRIKYYKSFLDSQVKNVPRVKDSEISEAISALRRHFPQLPPNIAPVPTDILADNIPFPEDSTEVGPNQMPAYFPQRGQEYDRFGRLNPVFVPYSIEEFEGTTYFPFDRRTLRLLVPAFKIAVAFDGGNLEGRNLPVYLALQDDGARIIRKPHFAVPDEQDPEDTRYPTFRHYQLI